MIKKIILNRKMGKEYEQVIHQTEIIQMKTYATMQFHL